MAKRTMNALNVMEAAAMTGEFTHEHMDTFKEFQTLLQG
jgi:hypothetical protein